MQTLTCASCEVCCAAKASAHGVTNVCPTLSQHYLDNDLKIRKCVPLIKDCVVYPVIYDANRVVLSLPPIINGAHSAVSSQHKCKRTYTSVG